MSAAVSPICPWAIALDTREQLPWTAQEMGSGDVPIVTKGLRAGDASIVGAEERIAVERKTFADYKGSITHRREPFMRELAILATYEFACVIVEANLADIEDLPTRSRVHPASVFGTTVAITLDHVPVLWCGDRQRAARFAFKLLKRFYEKRLATGAA